MNYDHNFPLALQRAQMNFWMRTGEALHENQGRWLALAKHLHARNAREARAETRETADAADGSDLASLTMNMPWRLLNHGLCNLRDLTVTTIDNQAILNAGMNRALASWQAETARALSKSGNTMPFTAMLKDQMEAAASASAEPAVKKGLG